MKSEMKKGERMKKIVDIAHELAKQAMHDNAVCCDFTLGQGYDATCLAQQPQCRRLYGFDIQQAAITESTKRLKAAGVYEKCVLFCVNHADCDTYIQEKLDVGIFNFGYLPHGDAAITTMADTSLCAVKKALRLLKVHGVLLLVVYPGHEQGKQESERLDALSSALPSRWYSVARITMHNKRNCPYILMIEKEKGEDYDTGSNL